MPLNKETIIGTTHSIFFTPLNRHTNSAFSTHSTTDCLGSVQSKRGINLGSKAIIAEIACVGMLQWIPQVSFPRLVRINTSTSYPSFPSVSPSFSPSSCNETFMRAHQLIHSERIPHSSHHRAFISSPDLERICIRANQLSPVRDLPTLHIVLEAAISVYCFYSTAHASFKVPDTLHPLNSQIQKSLRETRQARTHDYIK